MRDTVLAVVAVVGLALVVLVGVHSGVAFFTNSVTAAIHQGVAK